MTPIRNAICACTLAALLALSAGCNRDESGEQTGARAGLQDFPLSENPEGSWTQYAGNPAHDTFVGGELLSFEHIGELTKKPIFSNYSTAMGGLAIAGGAVFAASDDGTMAAYDAETGNQLWKSRALDIGRNYSSPTYHRGLLYCGTIPGGIVCLDAKSGRTVWRQTEPQGIRGVRTCPFPAGSSILFTDMESRFFRLDALTGEVLWMRELVRSEQANSDPVLESGTAIFATPTGHVYGLSPETAAVKWVAALFAGVPSSPVAKGGKAYFTGIDSGLYGVDASTGEFTLKFSMDSRSGATPLVKGDLIVSADDENNLYCVDLKTGKLVWKLKLKTSSGSLMFGFDNSILILCSINERIDLDFARARGKLEDFISRKGPFLAITREDRAKAVESQEEVMPRPISDSEVLSLAREDIDILWARRAEAVEIGWDGEILRTVPLPTALNWSPAYYKGKMYAPDINGSVQVLKLEIR